MLFKLNLFSSDAVVLVSFILHLLSVKHTTCFTSEVIAIIVCVCMCIYMYTHTHKVLYDPHNLCCACIYESTEKSLI